MHRLKMSDFKINSDTDYLELRALVILMEITVDNGEFNQHNLIEDSREENFNNDVDEFSMAIKNIFCGMGTPGAAFISKIKAKEAVETFSRRITLTMRTKQKSVHDWFIDRGKKQVILDGAKKQVNH